MVQSVSIEGEVVRATSPEGQTATIPLRKLLTLLEPRGPEAEGRVYPDGLKMEIPRGPLTIWVHETPPRVHNFKWIAKDSPAPFGPMAIYRQVRIALPYVIVMAVFARTRGGRLQLTKSNECFFRRSPLTSSGDKLLYPALLNVSKFDPPQERPLAWICTQYLRTKNFCNVRDSNRRMRAALKELLHCVFESGFNLSSENNEGASWFGESRGVDPRVQDVEHWESATNEDPRFVMDVPWVEVGMTVAEVAERIVTNLTAGSGDVGTAEDIARFVFNNGSRR